ncbi:MAG: branched-chain amino acid ABC transporter permease, partial [Actinobacteria bacterium]|nr:branched-chain amino acid ABC transporter permease [Actinomycetota bacterium]
MPARPLMKDYLPFLIAGTTAGSVYGLAAVGLALTYKTSGIFNFAHGAIAAAGAYIFFELHVERGWWWPVALLVAVGGVGVAGGLAVERLAQRLRDARPVLSIAATVGLLLAIQGALTLWYGFETRAFPTFLPGGGLTVAGVLVGWQSVFAVGVAALSAVALWALFRLTTVGLSMRAAVNDWALLDLAGGDPTRIRRTAWVVGCSFAALSGVLIAPLLGLDAGLL